MTSLRWYVIRPPYHPKTTPEWTKYLIWLIVVMTTSTTIWRMSQVFISSTEDGFGIPSMNNISYVILADMPQLFLLDCINPVEVWGLLPFLLFLNICFYREVRKYEARQLKLQVLERKRYFQPEGKVATYLTIGSAVHILNFLTIGFGNIVYRELVYGMFLSIGFNSLFNLTFYQFPVDNWWKEAWDFLTLAGLTHPNPNGIVKVKPGKMVTVPDPVESSIPWCQFCTPPENPSRIPYCPHKYFPPPSDTYLA